MRLISGQPVLQIASQARPDLLLVAEYCVGAGVGEIARVPLIARSDNAVCCGCEPPHVLQDRHRRLVVLSIAMPTLYLSLADSIAIGAGTWTFSPQQSTGWLIGGVLPVEELLFFLLTNTLIGFGMTLVMSSESQVRLRVLVGKTVSPAN